MRTEKPQNEVAEIAAYTRYYEHDGMLRAYANRAMLLAILFASIAVGALGFAIYVRVQPPTVIRIDKDGNAVVLGETRQNHVSQLELTLAAQPDSGGPDLAVGAAPKDLEGKAVVRRFLEHYLSY